MLFEALARLLAANSGIRLALVGDGAERSQLDTLARMKLDHAVTFLGARDDVTDLHQAFDIVVLSSHPPWKRCRSRSSKRWPPAARSYHPRRLRRGAVADGSTRIPGGAARRAEPAGALLRLCGDRQLREYGKKGQAGGRV